MNRLPSLTMWRLGLQRAILLPVAAAAGALGCADGGRRATDAVAASTRSTPARGSVAAPPPDVRSAGGFRFRGDPIAVFFGAGPDQRAYKVTFRLNRALPREGADIHADVALGVAGGATGPVRVGRKARHCYAQDVDASPVRGDRRPRAGTPVTVTVTFDVRGRSRTLRATVPLEDGSDDAEGAIGARLGCGSGAVDPQP